LKTYLRFSILVMTGLTLVGPIAAQQSTVPLVPAAAPLPPLPAAAPPARLGLPPDRSTALPPRQPDAKRLDELRGQRAFRYAEDEVAVNSPRNPLSAFLNHLLQRLFNWLNQRSYTYFWRWIIYAIFVVAGVFVILKLMQVDLTALLGRGPRRVALAYETEAENIHEVNFADRLAEAEASGNLRLAVRLGYLELLKTLTDNALIDWKPDKTNHAYLRELPEAGPLRPAFREILRQFEYVWYGEWPLGAGQYARVRQGQRTFAQQVAPARRFV
jgi:Domain of unknown function (DUF4129)